MKGYNVGDVLVEVEGGVVQNIYRMEHTGQFIQINPDVWNVLDWDDHDKVNEDVNALIIRFNERQGQ